VRRRDFFAALGAAAATPMLLPLSARGGEPRRVAVQMSPFAPTDAEGIASANAFADELRKRGWTDGDTIRIAYRWDAGDPARIKASAEEFAKAQPDVIVAATNVAVAELQRLTTTIPIVFNRVADPVGSGFAASLARPGGNITGFQASDAGLGGKWVEVLREFDPAVSRIAVVYGSDSGGDRAFLRAAETAAQSTAVALTLIDIHRDSALEPALAAFAREPGGGLIVVPHPWTTSNRKTIIGLAERYRLPAVYAYRLFIVDGGLISYGPDQVAQWRDAADYVDRILKGEKPSDLPIQAPTKYTLIVNRKAAAAIGLKISPAFSMRADEVIE
jgi:putative tryptophan/tyrosine transport system substrate-binding protein